MKFYLAVEINRGEEYYLAEDDDSISTGAFLDEEKVIDVLPDTSANRKPIKIQFHFSDYNLSRKVRQRVYDLLVPFDTNRNLSFD